MVITVDSSYQKKISILLFLTFLINIAITPSYINLMTVDKGNNIEVLFDNEKKNLNDKYESNLETDNVNKFLDAENFITTEKNMFNPNNKYLTENLNQEIAEYTAYPLNFSNLIGGTNDEFSNSIVVDSSDNIIMTGYTSSRDFPTLNAYDDTFNGFYEDCFISKFARSGSLLWSTFLGGSDIDYGYAVAIDSSDNIIVTGYTESDDFPTLNAYDSTYNGESDCFVSKFSSSGTLLWSTYLGGIGYDHGNSITIDNNNRIIVAGITYSEDFPTLNAYDDTIYGGDDLFITKFYSHGSLLWSTYLGGANYDTCSSITVDSSDDVIVIGYTSCLFFPAFNAYDNTYNGGQSDAFVTKFSSSGSLLWSTFLGGTLLDYGYDIAVDSSDNIVVVGHTESYNFQTRFAYDDTFNGEFDVFVAKFSSSGSLLWSTYLGGSDIDHGYGITINSLDNIIVTGHTYSEDLPLLSALQTAKKGLFDFYISEFSSSGIMVCSTFLGGNDEDYCNDLTIDNSDNIIVTGETKSIDFPITNSYYSNDFDACFLMKFSSLIKPININENYTINYSKLIGGISGDTRLNDVIFDDSGNSIIIGVTSSNDLPTINSYDSTYNGVSDVYITKFSSNGSLIWSTFFGGSEQDYGYAIAIDSFENIIVTGSTHSPDFPTLNANDSTYNGESDGFFSKFSSNGTLLWSTFLGGINYDISKSIAVDSLNNIIITGYTSSDDFPTINAYDDSYNTGRDAFITKYSNSGSLLWSTYLGGTSGDNSNSIVVDSYDNIIVTGDTYSSDFPIFNAFDSQIDDKNDGFASKFSSNGNLIWSTYLGGNDNDYGRYVAIDSENNIIITGYTRSDDFPILNAYDNTQNGSSDVFVAKFASSGSLLWSTYLGGSQSDSSTGIIIKANDEIIVTGSTFSLDFTEDVSLFFYNDNNFAFFSKLNSDGKLIYSSVFEDSYTINCRSIAYNPLTEEIIFVGYQDSSHSFLGIEYPNLGDGLYFGFILRLWKNNYISSYTFTKFEYLYGNSAFETFNNVISDIDDNLITVGTTSDRNISPLLNSYDSELSGNSDIFLCKFDSNGSLLWNTLIGGTESEWGIVIDIDSMNNILIGGISNSEDYPIYNAYDNTFNGNKDIVVTKFSSNGSLLWSTYLGGNLTDKCYDIVVDGKDDIIITGSTSSSNFPLVNASDADCDGYCDGFIAKLNSTGFLLWNSYIGGNRSDYCTAIDIDSTGNIYLTGITDSDDFFTHNGIDDLNNDSFDTFTMKITSNGSILWSTLIGGSSTDYSNDIRVDNNLSLYLVGYTISKDFPYKNSFDATLNGSSDGFITKLNNSGSIIWSNFLGGAESDWCSGLEINSKSNSIIIYGNTNSSNYFSKNSYYSTPKGYIDGFLIEFDFNCTILWSSLYGYQGYDYLNHIAVISSGDLALVGRIQRIGKIDNTTDSAFINYFYIPILDSDNDNMPNLFEYLNNLNMEVNDAQLDLDSDGLSNYGEYIIGTLVNNEDTDNDTILDGWEVIMGLNPFINDANDDNDNDSMPNLYEYQNNLNAAIDDSLDDTDGDGMPNLWEYKNGLIAGTNDSNLDPDGDNLSNLDEYLNNCSPNNSDSDSDLMSDGWEVEFGLNPNYNDANLDSDDDGLSNYKEYLLNLNPSDADTDGDGFPDGFEHDWGFNPNNKDSSPFLIIISIITIFLTILTSVTYYYKRYIPMHEKQLKEKIQGIIKEAKSLIFTEDCNITENSPLWNITKEFCSFKKSYRFNLGKKFTTDGINKIVSELPSNLESDEEILLIALNKVFLRKEGMLFTTYLNSKIHDRIKNGSFKLQQSDHLFMIKTWSIPTYPIRKKNIMILDKQIIEEHHKLLGSTFTDLESLTHLNWEFMPILAKLFDNYITLSERNSIKTHFLIEGIKYLSLGFKISFSENIIENAINHNINSIETILRTISIKELLNLSERNLESLVVRIGDLGINSYPLPYDFADISDLPLKDRQNFMSIATKSNLKISKDLLSKLLS